MKIHKTPGLSDSRVLACSCIVSACVVLGGIVLLVQWVVGR